MEEMNTSFSTSVSVNLVGNRVLNVSIDIQDLNMEVFNQFIQEADMFVELFLNAEMERYEFIINPTNQPNKQLDLAYNTAQKYLLQFGINMLEYMKMLGERDWMEIASLVVEDAMVVSRFLRDCVAQEFQERSAAMFSRQSE